MNHGSLFSGIGGFDIAAQWMGWNNVFHCEKDKFCRRVLAHHFPNAESYEDIKETDFTIWRGRIDILSGGFPCQPYSTAGKRKGKEDDRHLWPEMLRAIREIKPSFVVGENVRGLISWNGGLVFDEVQSDLEAEGYVVIPFLLPASGVNAPHERYRVWFVAYSGDGLHSRKLGFGKNQKTPTGSKGEHKPARGRNTNRERLWSELGASCEDVAYTDGIKCEEWTQDRKPPHTEEEEARVDNRTSRYGNAWDVANGASSGWVQNDEIAESKFTSQDIPDWRDFPTQSPLCSGNDGLSSELDGITFSRLRRESIKAAGNAVVPQLVLRIFRAISNCA